MQCNKFIQYSRYVRLLTAIVLLLAGSAPVLHGQPPADEAVTYDAGTDEAKTPEQEYEYRKFSESRLNELRGQREFQYDRMEEERQQERQEWEREMNRGKSKSYTREQPKERQQPAAKDSSNWLLILLVFGVAVAALMAVLGLKPGMLFRRKGSKAEPEAEAGGMEEDIHNMRFETELEKAIRLGNYRLAVRIQYLDTLKKLSDRNLIRWMPDKTNWEYARELHGTPYDRDFRHITSAFEYAWYGEFAIDEPVFRLMQEKMLDFQKKL